MTQPMATVYPRFSAQITSLQNQANSVSEAITGVSQRVWRVPDGWTTGVFDIENYKTPYTRQEMNDAYPNFFLQNGTINDAGATKWQSAHLSGQERAFRLQNQSGIRCAVHAAGRRKGHSDQQSGGFARIVDHVIDMIVDGGT